MTAGAPALTALLDELDRLRAGAGTDTPWRVGEHYGIHVYGGPDGQSPVATCHWDADAEFAVATVNAVPRLTAAIRATLEVADELASWPSARILSPHDAADRIRSAAALGATP